MCYHQITHLCQSKTLSFPDYESTYTNRASGVSVDTKEFKYEK